MVTTREKILITGASSGLGEGMARAFAAQGRALALCARRLDRLEALAAELRDSAAQVAVAQLDVTDFDSVPVVFGKLRDELGGLDRVIVNAGLGKGAPIGTGKARGQLGDRPDEPRRRAGPGGGGTGDLPGAGATGTSYLISSVSANRGLPKAQAAYSASKAGVTALGQALQAEFAGKPIAVTIIEPGYIETDISRGVKTRLMTKTDDGVAAMVAAIEAEKEYAAVPRWPWSRWRRRCATCRVGVAPDGLKTLPTRAQSDAATLLGPVPRDQRVGGESPRSAGGSAEVRAPKFGRLRFLPSSTPHWSKESMPQTAPSTNTWCS